jgi:hypothetical protein
VLGPDLVSFLESGCGLIIATVRPDGGPRAARAWGVDVVDASIGRIRVLLGLDDPELLDDLAERGAIAVTGADVVTLRASQVKGRVTGLVPATDADRERSARFREAFFQAIIELDGTPRALLDRMVPDDLIVAEVEIDAVFDQTPGPGAGVALGGRR